MLYHNQKENFPGKSIIAEYLDVSVMTFLLYTLQKPNDSLSKMIRELKMMNVSTLPLTTGLKLQQPFQIILDDDSRVSETVSTTVPF